MDRQLAQRELLDTSGGTRSEIQGNMRDIALTNRWLGGTAVVMRHLTRLIGDRPSRQPIRILDLATGGADIPIAIVDWAHKHRIAVQITAVDNNPAVVEIARRNTELYPEICVDLQDIRMLPYQHRSFEFVLGSLVIHHLDTPEVLVVLRSACRLATQGIVISDLHRRPFCMALAWIGSRFISNRLSRNDVQVSFENAFTPWELEDLAGMAALPCWKVYRHGPCRLALVVDMRSVQCRESLTSACHAPAVG